MDPKRAAIIEQRRLSLEQMEWQMPVVSLTGQAFLFTVTLEPSTSGLGRLIAALVGTVAAAAVLQLFLKHRFSEETHAEWIHTHSDVDFKTETLVAETGRKTATHWHRRSAMRRFVVDLPAWKVWAVTLLTFLLADLLILVLAILELVRLWTPLH